LIPPEKKTGASKFEPAIGYLLVFGVVTSLVLVGIGILFFYFDFGRLAISEKKAMFLCEQNFFAFLWDFSRGGNVQGRGIWLMTLGIAILILTPYARVIMSVVYFIAMRDIKYTLITLFVLVLLTLSLLLH
jgi:uncharacterized membrane protein